MFIFADKSIRYIQQVGEAKIFQPGFIFLIDKTNKITIVIIQIKKIFSLVVGYLKVYLLLFNNRITFFFFTEVPQ